MNRSPSLEFFNLAYENFLTAADQNQSIEKFYDLAGFSICLQFAGDSLQNFLTRSLDHLEIPKRKKDLTICIWDGASTQGASMVFPWPKGEVTVHGTVVGFNDERIQTVFDPHLGILQMLDQERSLALYWIEKKEKAPWWIGMSTFQFIFHWWMSRRHVQLTHAGAVGYSDGGVLFAGKSGSGKSTTSLSCVKRGMKYVSEDYCLISQGTNVQVHCVYNSVKITEKTLSLFPELEEFIENRDRLKGEKAYFFYSRFQPENILPSFPLKAVLALNIMDAQESSLEPIEPREALASLAGTTLWQLPHTGPSVFNHLKKVAESVPCYRLHLGRDLTHPPKLIERLLLTRSNQ